MMTSDTDIDNKLIFKILYESQELTFKLSKLYGTVGDLKLQIFEKLGIFPSKQIIDCWFKKPEDDFDTLEKCCHSGCNYLVLHDSDESNMSLEDSTLSLAELETSASVEFIEYFSQNFDDLGILFHVCRLEDAVNESCFTSLERRKILLLYLHNKSSPFAKIFSQNISHPEVKEIVNNNFFLLGWDVENTEYHPALIEALSTRAELSLFVNFIEKKTCAALLIVPIKNSFTVFSCITSKVSKKNFLQTLQKAQEFLATENEIEQDLGAVKESKNDVGSTKYQQIMLDLLGDRDYDSFDHFELEFLKDKILYALYGPPELETGYNDKQKKRMNALFDVIIKENNTIAKWKDRIVISFIYNCTEPLPSEKQKRAKKFKKDYNHNTDLSPVPLFVLPKCKNSENPCRLVIDDVGRVYKTWNGYLTRNKLHQCEMVLPLNGRYKADEQGRVILERHLSPACGIDVKILQGTDIANTAAAMVSGGIVLAAAIPAITVAPVALIAAGATGLGVGLYALGRSAYTLYDRSRHKETLSFANSEARGAYLNILAGSLGFVGAGANIAVSQLAARGFNIGQGATAAVNVLSVANISASGISIVNSGYDVFDQWFNDNQVPSLLTLVQLSSSILFFGHAVYSFQLAGTIIEESQTRTLREYHDSLRSNRHRKTFNKLMKETIRQNEGHVQKGQAQVIKTITSLPNKDDVFATLTRLNKQMNKNDVKFAANSKGEITLNGVSLDISILGSMDSNEVTALFNTLPNTPEPTQAAVAAMSSKLKVGFTMLSADDICILSFRLLKIFNGEDSIKDKIINAGVAVISTLTRDFPGIFQELGKIFPNCDKYIRIIIMVNGYFQALVVEMEKQYQAWLSTRDPALEEPIFAKLALRFSQRAGEIFDFVSSVYFMDAKLTEAGLRKLITYFHSWFAKQAIEFEEHMKRKQERVIHSASPALKTKCPDCGGEYYH